MLRCREVSTLVSESMEQRLPLRRRMELKMHLLLCRLCAGFARQARLLRQVAQKSQEHLESDKSTSQATLTPDARNRIKSALQDHRS